MEGGRGASPFPLWIGSGGLSFGQVLFEQFAQGLHVEIAVAIDPVLVGLDRERADQPQAARFVGEDAHDVRAALELLVEPFEQVGRLEVLVMLQGQPVIGEGFLDVRLRPRAQPGVLVLPAFQLGVEAGQKVAPRGDALAIGQFHRQHLPATFPVDADVVDRLRKRNLLQIFPLWASWIRDLRRNLRARAC